MNFRVLQIFRWFIGLGWDFLCLFLFFQSRPRSPVLCFCDFEPREGMVEDKF